jgi:RNA polymerase sigma-70 factor, ECF subfamily
VDNKRVITNLERFTSAAKFGTEHIDSLYRYALMLTRNRDRAEDLVQETYVRAIEAFSRLQKDSNVRGWLFTILRNLWLNELRRQRSGPAFVEVDAHIDMAEGLVGNMPNAQKILESHEDARRVRAAIAQLPEEFREVLILREFEELSYQEIATVLACPAGTVMSRLGRARARLRVLLTTATSTPLQAR